MRIGTAEPVSTFISQGEALATVLPRHGVPAPIEVLASPGASIDNANRLDAGEIDFGFMAANWIGRARRGEAPFGKPIDLAMVAPMNAGPLFFVALRSSGLRTFDDLAGKRVSVGLQSSGMTQHARTFFKALGRQFDEIEPAYLSFADGAEALKRGEVDAQLQCPIPNRIMSALDDSADLVVLDFKPEQLDTMLRNVGFYRRARMRTGRLRALDRDLDQPGVLNVLVCHRNAEAAQVRSVAGAVFSAAAELAAANQLFEGLGALFEPLRSQGPGAFDIDGVELHPGALAAYRSAGLVG